MPEGFIQVTEGAGKKLRTFERTVGANQVHEEITILGEPHLAGYIASTGAGVTAAAAGLLASLNAGASLKLRVRRVVVWQTAVPAAAAQWAIRLRRLVSLPTGGTAVTPQKLDLSSAAAGATFQYVPTANITYDVTVEEIPLPITNAQPITGLYKAVWEESPRSGPLVIPAGTANGLAVYLTAGAASATVAVTIEFAESNA